MDVFLNTHLSGNEKPPDESSTAFPRAVLMIQVVRVLLADGKGAGCGLLKMAGVEFLHQPDERNGVPGTAVS